MLTSVEEKWGGDDTTHIPLKSMTYPHPNNSTYINSIPTLNSKPIYLKNYELNMKF